MTQHLTKRFLVNVTEDELKHIDACVTSAKMSRSQYTRMLYSKVIPRTCPSKELLEVLDQLRRIGVNINQIAYVANKTNSIDSNYFKTCQSELQMAISEIKNIMQRSYPLEVDDGNN